MNTTIKTQIVKVGNSQGIRIPKRLLEQSGIDGEVEIEVQRNQLVIRAAMRSRSGWVEAFEKMAEQGDDLLIDAETTNDWDDTEWEW
ncbi:MAG: AbrB/MazE/SpoVT family DNA-binding domain-containing protein [Phormidium tanganyikae FI6-MK23]|jgi:antitoxin MazE|nr:AbrB/MazE/SpoVT family DNA-binding domain-containing protein [Phormidium tanganyikae FI6-MK23]